MRYSSNYILEVKILIQLTVALLVTDVKYGEWEETNARQANH